MHDLSFEGVRASVAPDAEGRFGPKTAAGLSLAVIGVASVAAVLLPAVQNDGKRFLWYRLLDKPKTTPPDPVFGIAWPIIEIAMAYAGYRLLQQPASVRRNAALGWLGFNLALIPGYQALFFTARSITGGLVSAAALAGGAWTFMATAWPVDRRAAVAGAPLALWTSFATYLMVEVWRRNAKLAGH